MRYQVKLSKPVIPGENSSLVKPINNAEVKLIEGDDTFLYELTDEQGVCQTIDSLSGTVGKTYTLVVKYENQTYTATDSIIPCDSVLDYPISEVCLRNGYYTISTTSPTWLSNALFLGL